MAFNIYGFEMVGFIWEFYFYNTETAVIHFTSIPTSYLRKNDQKRPPEETSSDGIVIIRKLDTRALVGNMEASKCIVNYPEIFITIKIINKIKITR